MAEIPDNGGPYGVAAVAWLTEADWALVAC